MIIRVGILICLIGNISVFAQRIKLQFEINGESQIVTSEFKLCLTVEDTTSRIFIFPLQIDTNGVIFDEMIAKYEVGHIMFLSPDNLVIGPFNINPHILKNNSSINSDTASNFEFSQMDVIGYLTFGFDKRPFTSDVFEQIKDKKSKIIHYLKIDILGPSTITAILYDTYKSHKRSQKISKSYFTHFRK